MSPFLTLLCRRAGRWGGWQLTTHCFGQEGASSPFIPLTSSATDPMATGQTRTEGHSFFSLFLKICFPHFYLSHHLAYGLLFPPPRIEPMPPAVEAPSLNHWTTREVPLLFFFFLYHLFCGSLQDLSSLIRDGIPAQLQWKPGMLTIRPPGNSLPF